MSERVFPCVCIMVSCICACVSEDQWLGQFYSIHVTLISTGANLCVGACFAVCALWLAVCLKSMCVCVCVCLCVCTLYVFVPVCVPVWVWMCVYPFT